jgi:hypothetical protein
VGHRRKPALVTDVKVESPGLSLTYPKVSGLKHKSAESSINRYIKREIHGLLKEEGYGVDENKKFTGGYTVKLNKRGTMSILLEIYCHKKGEGHGNTYRKFINVSLKDARVYYLEDLFSRKIKKAKLISILNELIKDQLKSKAVKFTEEFNSIALNHTYFLTEDSLVICFEMQELTPVDSGLLEFIIPFLDIEDIINTKGPIGRLLRDRDNSLNENEETADE